MTEMEQDASNADACLEDMIILARNAAETIERLRTEVHLRDERIRQLERSEADLREAARRYQRMKAQLEALPAAKGGFTAHGTTYASFDEAFDAAYPGVQGKDLPKRLL